MKQCGRLSHFNVNKGPCYKWFRKLYSHSELLEKQAEQRYRKKNRMKNNLIGSVDCTNDAELYRNGTYSRCPTVSGKYFVPVLMGLYMLICNILLLNLLVAMFTETFQDQEYRTNLYWNLQLNNLIDEYGNRSFLAPPFTVFEHVYRLIALIVRKRSKCSEREPSAPRKGPFLNDFPHMSKEERRYLLEWEDDIADNFHYARKQAANDDTDQTVQSTTWQFEQLETQIVEMQKQQQALTETKFEIIEKQLQWIMDSLIEHNLGSSRDTPEVNVEDN
ncbi:hypothetical protein CHS0354_034629 [Potamilus streckersoni]|uniref:Ion transport domain-containing protein n=1 Tax=Potamilus streckersoni TaxID=2493646 RepID=A0AAE0TC31_9BIVA|nr:hypothetical protein CHS0354_034629 [Potamilus streckersoni]